MTDEFTRAVENDVGLAPDRSQDGESIGEAIAARQLMQEIAEAAWQMVRPGVPAPGRAQKELPHETARSRRRRARRSFHRSRTRFRPTGS